MALPILPQRWLITSANLSGDPTVFPLLPGQLFLTEKAPHWMTAIAIATTGAERRQQRWSYPQWTFKVSYEVLRDKPSYLELQTLLAFFNMHAGQCGEWLYSDPSDRLVSGQSFGVGDGTTTQFQLTRSMGLGAISFTEPVLAVGPAPTVLVNGVSVTNFSVGSRGVLTFFSPPAAGATLTWSGTFYFVCRFAQDDLPVAQMMDGLWEQQGLSFISIRS